MTYKNKLNSILGILLLCLTGAVFHPLAAQQNDEKVPDYMKLKRIVIDPGHGGKDIGAPGETSRTHEKDLNLQIARKLGDKIKEMNPDIEILYTRETEVFVPLADRANFSNRNNADLFIAVHINSSKNKSSTGPAAFILSRHGSKDKSRDYFEESRNAARNQMEVITYDESNNVHLQKTDPQKPETVIMNELQWSFNHKMSLILAREIEKQFKKPPFLQSRYAKVQQGAFFVLRRVVCPFVYLEFGFISNHQEYLILSNPQQQDKMAEMMAEAVTEYRRIYEHSDDESLMKEYENLEEPVFNSEVNEGTYEAENDAASQDRDAWYAIQIMGLGRLLEDNDPALKGLKATALRPKGSNVYRYLTARSATLDECREKLAQVRKKFPDAFMVRVEGDMITRQ